jgi:hypothetical protein
MDGITSPFVAFCARDVHTSVINPRLQINQARGGVASMRPERTVMTLQTRRTEVFAA